MIRAFLSRLLTAIIDIADDHCSFATVETARAGAEQDRLTAWRDLQDARRRKDTRDIHRHTQALATATTEALRRA